MTSKKAIIIIAALSILFSGAAAKGCGEAEDDSCNNKTKALPLKIIAIVTILIASIIGVSLPLVTRSVPALSPDRSLFVIVKAFAAGIILATGFMHVLPDSFEMLSSECLKENPWHKFPFTGFVAMLSAIVTLMIDSLATSIYSKKHSSGGVVQPEEREMAAVEAGHFHGHHHGGKLEVIGSQLLRYRVIAMPCNSCNTAPGAVFCGAHSAFLCPICDADLHAPPTRHPRFGFCDVCEQSPAAVTCKAEAADLCSACYAEIHAANPLARRHHRLLVLPFYHAAAEDFSDEEVEAASWILPDPNSKPDLDSGSPRGANPGRAELKQASTDGVVPGEDNREYESGQYPGRITDGFPAFDLEYSGLKPFMYNFTPSQSINQSVLELGIIVHSVVIGLSMGASNNTCSIKGLIAALCFHQMFEGMGLGGCILQAEYKLVKKAGMAFFFAVTTPFGIALGIALAKTYQENSPRALITVGLLNASSAGLLIYMALVDLLAADFMGPKLQGSVKLQIKSFMAVFLGAGGMSLMAKWA